MAAKKRGLGKGLSALIGDKPIVDSILDEKQINENAIEDIPLSKIIAKKDQPRKEFEREQLEELAKSIEIHGVIQPIILRKKEKKYEIIAGERRFRASKIAGKKEIPSIIIEIDDEGAAKFALIENIQREDLNPIEEATGYKRLMEEFDLKQEELAQAVGKSRTYITNALRLLNLEKKIIDHISSGKLSPGHGKALLGIKDKKEQINLADKIISEELNVRETEKRVKESKEQNKKDIKKKIKTKTKSKDPHTLSLEEEMMRSLGTKVNLIPGNKVGKIEIEYYTEEDLERIYEVIIH